MKWQVVARPEAEDDVRQAARWYNTQNEGLGNEFIEEVLTVFDALSENPLLHCRRHPTKNIRWRYPHRFPYRIVYEVVEDQQLVVIAAVVHAARPDPIWQSRFE